MENGWIPRVFSASPRGEMTQLEETRQQAQAALDKLVQDVVLDVKLSGNG
jgi:hypothetical protein